MNIYEKAYTDWIKLYNDGDVTHTEAISLDDIMRLGSDVHIEISSDNRYVRLATVENIDYDEAEEDNEETYEIKITRKDDE